MARSRNLKPGFFLNEQLAECTPLARLLFAGLWCLADREGRLEDRPARIQAQALPFDRCDLDDLLDQLARRGFIRRYQAQGGRYIEVCRFLAHQRPHPHEAASQLPPPAAVTCNDKCAPSSLLPSSLIPDSLEGSEPPAASEPTPDRAESLGATKAALQGEASPCSCADPVVLTFPVVGGSGGKGPAEWSLTRSKIAEYQATFPALDILRHCRVACQWCRDNPAKRKTARGMGAFLLRWLAKEQNRGNVQPAPALGTPAERARHVAQQRAEAEAERQQAEADAANVRRMLDEARHSRNGPQGRRDA